MFQDIWHQLKNNKWLYATHEPLEVIIGFKEQVETITINKTGILILDPNCKALTKNTILLAKFTNSSNTTKDFIPSFHLPKVTLYLDSNREDSTQNQKIEYI